RPMAGTSFRSAPAPGAFEGTIIPYDHAATFELKGLPGNIVQDVINVSGDGVFVATAVGYGFEEQRARPINNPASPAPAPAAPVPPAPPTLAHSPPPPLTQ